MVDRREQCRYLRTFLQHSLLQNIATTLVTEEHCYNTRYFRTLLQHSLLQNTATTLLFSPSKQCYNDRLHVITQNLLQHSFLQNTATTLVTSEHCYNTRYFRTLLQCSITYNHPEHCYNDRLHIITIFLDEEEEGILTPFSASK